MNTENDTLHATNLEKEMTMSGAYLTKGTIGNVGMPGAPVVYFSLIVVPSTHKVTGAVHICQAIENGNYLGSVSGTIYATGYNNVTKVVAITGTIHCETKPEISLPFEASMAINDAWCGSGGFTYGTKHIEDVPVQSLNNAD